jgi:hypothetical protein
VHLDLILRGSCGRSTLAYDISCVASIDVRVVDAGSGEVLDSACNPVSGQLEYFSDLVASVDPIPLLEDTEARGNVRIELRGYHAFDTEPCNDPTDDELMMWGSSGVVDLDDDTLESITIQFECRPDCDCVDLGNDPTNCPAVLVPGACAPIEAQLCRRECEAPEDCYGGATLTCSEQRCTPVQSGGTCAQCDDDGDCSDGRCITNANTTERFCAPRCPPLGAISACPTRMSCKRLDGDPFAPVP